MGVTKGQIRCDMNDICILEGSMDGFLHFFIFLFYFLRDGMGWDWIESNRPVCMAGFGGDLFTYCIVVSCMNRIKRLGVKENEI